MTTRRNEDNQRGCSACGKRHTMHEPCDFAKRCPDCGDVKHGGGLCERCHKRRAERGERPR